MTKRTAMLMAAGVVAALVRGLDRARVRLSGNTAASADPPEDRRSDRAHDPSHGEGREGSQAGERQVQVVTLSSDTSSVDAVSSDDAVEDGSGDDAFEDEADDAFEDEADDQFEDESHDSATTPTGPRVTTTAASG